MENIEPNYDPKLIKLLDKVSPANLLLFWTNLEILDNESSNQFW